ncbi:hypothetical protein [Pararhodobacter sp.]|uniref:hypothetical protein n=1 Tax=Pararhodobacter sp. TaxID=2127056 RepID=UPI002FDF025C
MRVNADVLNADLLEFVTSRDACMSQIKPDSSYPVTPPIWTEETTMTNILRTITAAAVAGTVAPVRNKLLFHGAFANGS